MEFRNLKAEEIDVRVQSVKAKGCVLLLYKDARCDMNILDETVGALNWQRKHTRDNHNCIVSIWDKEKSQWIEKEDTGTESFTEKEKGLASDSFKRACFNWGIGRELYTSPFIWINLEDKEISEYNGKKQVKTRFEVASIEVDEGKIIQLAITDGKKFRYEYGKKQHKSVPKSEPTSDEKTKIAINMIYKIAKVKAIDVSFIDGEVKRMTNQNDINKLTGKQLKELHDIIAGL